MSQLKHDHRDSIRSDEILSGPVLCRRLGWGRHTLARARRDGLQPWVKYGRGMYVRGADVVRFFDRLVEKHTEVPDE